MEYKFIATDPIFFYIEAFYNRERRHTPLGYVTPVVFENALAIGDNLNENTVLKRSDNAVFEKIAGEAILIRLDTGTYFSLNKVGTEFWEMLDGRQSIGDHALTIAARYDVDSAMVEADLLELAGKMAGDDLVDSV